MAIERVFGLLSQRPGIVDKPGATKLETISNGFQFENVNFEYIKNKPVLKNINLNVKKVKQLHLLVIPEGVNQQLSA